MPTVTIITGVPTSVNRTRGEHWSAARRRKQRLQNELRLLLLAEQVPCPIPGDRVHATAVIVHPTRRRRDEGNFRAPLEKALGDALCPPAGDYADPYLSDDTPEHFTFGTVTFAVDPSRAACCHLTLTWGDDLDQAVAA